MGPADEDRALIRRLIQRDGAALEMVIARHGGAVLGFVRRSPFAGNAEDVVQDVFASLWQRPERFDPQRGSLRSFLLLLARGRSLDVMRASLARERREDRCVDLRTAISDEVELRVLREDQRRAVRAALDVLLVTEREAIELAFFGGRSYRDVAAILGVAEGTVKSRIRRGLERLSVALRQHAELVP